MKKLILALMLLAVPSFVNADNKLPSWYNNLNPKQGIGFSLVDNRLNSYTSVEVAKWKYLSFDAGVLGDSDSTDWKAGGSVSIRLLDLRNIIEIPILDKIVFEPGIYFAVGRIDVKNLFQDSETDWGASIKIISLSW